MPKNLTDFEKYLLAEGTYDKAYDKLGAHVVEHEGVKGIHFAVWAPNAHRVDVVGNFNHWKADLNHTLTPQENSGIWSGFFPDLHEGELYKYLIHTRNHGVFEKADPYAFQSELRPKSASVVANIDKYQWNDHEWVQNREKKQHLNQPISIYEVHLSSWKRGPNNSFLNYKELAHDLVKYVKDLGYTHIELLPISEHPLDASWGYQTIGYFAPTSRFGNPDEFQYFVDYCHQNNIGVLLDWVPAHFPKDAQGLGFFDGTHLYEHSDPRQGEHQDWGTFIFNYSRHEVRTFLLSAALFWIDKYHIDGYRTDAVSSMLYLDYAREDGQWIPNEFGGNENLAAIQFLKMFNEKVHQACPGFLSIAEESTAWPMVSKPTYMGGLGFTLKWNMGWMHDTLMYMSKESIHRKYHHNDITFSMLYAFSENFVLPLSHDEVVHGKGSLIDNMSGDLWQKFATLRAYYAYMFGHPGKKLLFMGGEFAQWAEWNFDQSLDWHLLEFPSHQGVQQLIRQLNHLYRNEPSLYENDFDWDGFEWINANDSDNSVLVYKRKAKSTNDEIIFASNFTPVPRQSYCIAVDYPGFYSELLNTDSDIFWGSNIGNAGGLHSECFNDRHHLIITLPPLATVVFKRTR